MALHTITDGPSSWHLMLSIFDAHPMSGGTRTLSFTLKCGYHMRVEVNSVRRPTCPLDHWTLEGNSTSLPHGYYYSSRELVISYDPMGRSGSVELQLTSPCCSGAQIGPPMRTASGDFVRSCSQCRNMVLHKKAGGWWFWTEDEITRQNGGRPQELRLLGDTTQ